MRAKGLARESTINNIMFSHMHAVEKGLRREYDEAIEEYGKQIC